MSNILYWIGFAALTTAAWISLAENKPHIGYAYLVAASIAFTIAITWDNIQPLTPP